MKKLLSVFVFVPALLVCVLSKETLKEGLYSKSFGCIATLILMGIGVNILLHYAKVKSGFVMMGIFAAIIIAGLAIATLF